MKALEASLGVVSTACMSCGVPRSTFYEWMNSDPVFKQQADAVNDLCLDFAESKLFQLINGVKLKTKMKDKDGKDIEIYEIPPNVAATIFFLKTRGKHRGYVERTEVTGKDGEALISRVSLELKGSHSPLLKLIQSKYGIDNAEEHDSTGTQ